MWIFRFPAAFPVAVAGAFLSGAGANLKVLLADALHAKHLLIERADSPIFFTTMARYRGRAMVPDGHALSP